MSIIIQLIDNYHSQIILALNPQKTNPNLFNRTGFLESTLKKFNIHLRTIKRTES